MIEYGYIWELRAFVGLGESVRWVKGRVLAENANAAMERLFKLMNTGNQPEGYRSMSVGDVLTLIRNGVPISWVCASNGWDILAQEVDKLDDEDPTAGFLYEACWDVTT